MADSSSEDDEVPLALLQQSIDSGSSGDEFDELTLDHYVGQPFEMTNCDRDRVIQVDTLSGWSTEDGDGPVIAPFTGESKLNVRDLPAEPTPLDFFNLFFEEDMWNKLLEQTNKYAEDKLAVLDPKPHSRFRSWVPVTLPEMKLFLAISLSFGLTQKPDLDLYWTTDPLLETPIYGKLMSRDRYLLILSNLHLVPNDPPDRVAFEDPLYKLRPLIDMIQRKFIDVYTPGRDISFDEGTCPWKGRLKFKVYNPAKPNKFGIKLYQVSESLTGYIIGFDIYSGKTDYTCGSPEEFAELVGVDPEACTTTTKLVVGLLAKCGLLDEGCHVYMDNYYTSPELFTELDVRNTYACGTVRKNRRDVPRAFSEVKLRQGEVIFRRKENMLGLKWHDKRDVHLLSTIHRPFWKNVRGYRDRVVAKPMMVVDYVNYMGGVDLSDQLVQYYSCLRKTVKWWRKLFFHLLQLSVLNAYITYLKYGRQKITHFAFMKYLIMNLCEESAASCPTPTPQRKRAGEDLPTRLKEKHFPAYIPAKPGAKRARPVRDCYACNPKKKLRDGYRRRQSSFWCPECQRTLCVPDCFMAFHKYKDYRRKLGGNASEPSSDVE